MSPRTVLVHAGICDIRMWDGFGLPGEVLRHQLPAELVVISGAGHLPSMERPEATAELVPRFLEM